MKEPSPNNGGSSVDWVTISLLSLGFVLVLIWGWGQLFGGSKPPEYWQNLISIAPFAAGVALAFWRRANRNSERIADLKQQVSELRLIITALSERVTTLDSQQQEEIIELRTGINTLTKESLWIKVQVENLMSRFKRLEK